jgi:hypothetical protein
LNRKNKTAPVFESGVVIPHERGKKDYARFFFFAPVFFFFFAAMC